jgi:2-keto-4-pentenoate hydratase/2-oxohepta-3-ene-1,7-dioic acid hydratase in catechol pathway
MRYATVAVEGTAHVAVEDTSGFRLVQAGAGRSLSDLLTLLPDERQDALAPAGAAPAGARRMAPLAPQSIVAVGLNYLDHIRETGMDRPRVPLLFGKLRSSSAPTRR